MITGATVPAWVSLENALNKTRWLPRNIPRIALAIGLFWIAGLGLRFGIRAGGDTTRYTQYAERFKVGTVSFPELFKVKGNYHATYMWIAWIGPTAFVLAVAALSALMPWCILKILDHCHVGLLGKGIALIYAAANPELYKWAWYTLTDGFFIVQQVLLLALLSRQARSKWALILLPLLLYSFVFTRPGSFIFFPGLLAFAWLSEDRMRRYGLLIITLLLAAGFTAAYLVLEQNSLGDAMLRNFVQGQIVDAPPRSPEPLARPFTPEQVAGLSFGEACKAYPFYCGKYFWSRFVGFLLPVYPWYSLRHQLFNLLYFGSLLGVTLATGIALLARARQHGWKLASVSLSAWRMWLLAASPVVLGAAVQTATVLDSDARYLIGCTFPWIIAVGLQADMLVKLNRAEARR